MAELQAKCPTTGEWTGIGIHLGGGSVTVRNMRFRCRACGEMHDLDGLETRIEGAG